MVFDRLSFFLPSNPGATFFCYIIMHDYFILSLIRWIYVCTNFDYNVCTNFDYNVCVKIGCYNVNS
jgi:hypothetical protein